MARGVEISPQLRSRICELRSIGYSCNRIAKIYRDIPLSSIKTICRRECIRVNNTTRPRSGRPRQLTEEQRHYLYDLVTYENPDIKNRDLVLKVDGAVKERSIQRLMRET